ncbi:hypothetical protein ACT9NR_22245 (plasmid) [Natrialba aegyptia]
MKYDRRIDSRRDACYGQAIRDARTDAHENNMIPFGDTNEDQYRTW